MKNWWMKWSPRQIWKRIVLHDQLVEALDHAYLDACTFLNEGDFKRKVVWDAGYIVDALDKARDRKPSVKHDTPDFIEDEP